MIKMEVILAKMGEVVLKGLNRRQFEQRMIKNIKYRLVKLGKFRVYSVQSTVYIEPEDDGTDMDAVFEAAGQVFGIISLCRAYSCEKDMDAIIGCARERLRGELMEAQSFKVESKRSDKSFPLKSPEISKMVGGELAESFPHLKVDVHNPGVTVYVEVRDYAAFVHTDPVPGAGGLPIGTSGKAMSLLSGGIDSPVSTYMMAKRGLELETIHFFSYPYTSERAKQKVLDLAKLLTRYCGNLNVHVVPFTKIQEEIRDNCPEEYSTLIMRRSMMRVAELAAKKAGCDALITGESLGQVASQTVRAMGVTGAAVLLPVFRPLVGMDKEEIVKISRGIGTFETSILPYEDCCTVFTPKHPRTKPVLEEVERAESGVDFAALEREALENIETVTVTLHH